MDKYQKTIIGLLIGVFSVAVIYIFVVINGTGGSGSDGT